MTYQQLVASLAAPVLALVLVVPVAHGAPAKRRPLSPTDAEAIARLLAIEEARRFDRPLLERSLASTHPEVRRRAVLAVSRIGNADGPALLAPARTDRDAEVVATVAFALGQLKDPGAVAWLGQTLVSRLSPAAVAREAACALGKIRTPEARAALAKYLGSAPSSAAAVPVVGEALLAIGRFTTREDLAPIVRWTTARDPEVRWRAAWALFRPRDPAAVPHLLTLCDDGSADVRAWAIRGLAPAVVAASPVDQASAAARLRKGLTDPDRRVRTEALRALVQYEDD